MMRYDLTAMIRSARTKPRPFRRIEPTHSLKADMVGPYSTLVRAWEAELDRILRSYEAAHQSGDPGSIERAMEAAAARVAALMPATVAKAQLAIAGLDRWHRLQWIRRVHASTGLDVTHMTGQGDTAAPVEQAQSWANQLSGSIHRDTHSKMTLALLAGMAALKPAARMRTDLTEVLRKARRRAINAGIEQTDRTSAAMDRARRSAAGLSEFIWHHTPQHHPRADHKARDGRRYREDRAPNDRAGTLPFCKCWEEPLLV